MVKANCLLVQQGQHAFLKMMTNICARISAWELISDLLLIQYLEGTVLPDAAKQFPYRYTKERTTLKLN